MPQSQVDALTDEEWAEHWQDLLWVRDQERKQSQTQQGGSGTR